MHVLLINTKTLGRCFPDVVLPRIWLLKSRTFYLANHRIVSPALPGIIAQVNYSTSCRVDNSA